VPALTVEGPEPPYEVRPWRPGDRIRLARLGGHSRKLSDLYIDTKLPREARRAARVVVGRAGQVEWAEHVGPAAGSRVEVSLTPPDSVASNKD
jgi:tRNA(Ile)-lysidine synthetase-like protein